MNVSKSFSISVTKSRTKLTNPITFAPSVKLPAPSVTIKSAFSSLTSFTTSSTSSYGVCGLIPLFTPTTFPSKAFSNLAKASVSEIDLETIM